MISKTESGRVGYRKEYRVAGRVRVPAGHCQGDIRWLIHGDTEDSDDTLEDCVKEYHKYK